MKLTKGKISKLLNKKKQTKKLYRTKNKNMKNKKTFRIRKNINLSNTSLKNIKYKRSKGGKNTAGANIIEETAVLEKEESQEKEEEMDIPGNSEDLSKDVSKSIDAVLHYVTTEIANKNNTELKTETEIKKNIEELDEERNDNEINTIDSKDTQSIEELPQELTSEMQESEPSQLPEIQEITDTQQEITDTQQEIPEIKLADELFETEPNINHEDTVIVSQNQVKKPRFRLTKKSRAK